MYLLAALFLLSSIVGIFGDCAEDSCRHSETCCPTLGESKCCPLPNGVCCVDSVHCCPEGALCDIPAGKCVWKSFNPNEFQKRRGEEKRGDVDRIKEINAHRKHCGEDYYCLRKHTCCIGPNGEPKCCPLPKATCCPDKLHCCPHHEKCDVNSQTCFWYDILHPTTLNLPPIPDETMNM